MQGSKQFATQPHPPDDLDVLVGAKFAHVDLGTKRGCARSSLHRESQFA